MKNGTNRRLADLYLWAEKRKKKAEGTDEEQIYFGVALGIWCAVTEMGIPFIKEVDENGKLTAIVVGRERMEVEK